MCLVRCVKIDKMEEVWATVSLRRRGSGAVGSSGTSGLAGRRPSKVNFIMRTGMVKEVRANLA